MASEVKVGQVWRGPNGLNYVLNEAYVEGHGFCWDVAEGWTLVQDVPASAGCHCWRNEWKGNVFTHHGIYGCGNSHSAQWGTPCEYGPGPAWVLEPAEPPHVKGACPDCNGRRYEPASGWFAWCACPKPDLCAALRASLPKSGDFVESRRDPTPGIRTRQEDAAVDAAKADLRKRLATLRTWPTCPVSGVALTVRAEVLLQTRPAGHPKSGDCETLRTWTARLCCEGCEGGVK